MNLRCAVPVCALCIIAGGCSSLLAPRPDPSRFFVLTPIPNRTDPAAGAASPAVPPKLGVGPIEFPQYLRRPQMVTASAPNRLDISEERRWAEPLDQNFKRVLCDNLALLLNNPLIEKYPWSRRIAVDYQVVIEVERFETTTDGRSQLLARWAIKDGGSGEVLYSSRTAAGSALGAGENGPSAALSNDLAILSRDIAAQIAELERHRKPTVPARG